MGKREMNTTRMVDTVRQPRRSGKHNQTISEMLALTPEELRLLRQPGASSMDAQKRDQARCLFVQQYPDFASSVEELGEKISHADCPDWVFDELKQIQHSL